MRWGTLTRNEVQDTIAGIVQNVLYLDVVDRKLAFIDLGGDSLDAMRIVSRIRGAYNVELSTEEFFFSDASVEELSQSVIRLLEDAGESIDAAK